MGEVKRALIYGVGGQDGSYLAELLLEKGYEVHGVIRRSSNFNTQRIDHIFNKLHLHFGDVTDSISVMNTVAKVYPDEIYNLAAQSHVQVSFEIPEYTANADALGTLRILEAIKEINRSIRFYQASTSELFGNNTAPQSELTPFDPRSPYACAKLYAYHMVKNYREAYGLHASNGILFNHESPRRGETFVTRKVTKGFAKIAVSGQGCVSLGNLDARRDWGHAKDYVEAMRLMLQQDTPGDFVIATGISHSVRDLCDEAAKNAFGKFLQWTGSGTNEVGKNNGNIVVMVDPKYYRPLEVNHLRGDANNAWRFLQWKPNFTFEGMIYEMVMEDINNVKLGK